MAELEARPPTDCKIEVTNHRWDKHFEVQKNDLGAVIQNLDS